ncbi:MAG: hypothetical protein K0R45_1332, partial [Pseudomonas sp.]|nr:hypothetical protein [Pseudomonas sp.]
MDGWDLHKKARLLFQRRNKRRASLSP